MSMPEKMRPQAVPAVDHEPAEWDREGAAKVIRERMAGADWTGRLEARTPEALDLAARVLAVIAGPLRGAQRLLAQAWGLHHEHVSEWLRGARSMPAHAVWLLFLTPTRECGQAADDLLELLASLRGRTLGPRSAAPVDILAMLADLHQAASGFVDHGLRAVAPNSEGGAVLTSAEARAGLRLARALKEQVARAEATLEQAVRQ
jgi:hypothetical protein